MAVAAATVLTVDDDPVVRADLRLVLEDTGFAVCADARDGIEAVELARTKKPDVILLDLALPRLDGVQASRRRRPVGGRRLRNPLRLRPRTRSPVAPPRVGSSGGRAPAAG